ncbi:hypothetical protein [Caldimonas brevitalea]|uniref:Secreted protein n=1 Tax=Caldimonas brevitalea TaxID=413882 RepID=A0A0G3BV26_9BURK|nr:hypothetical protein [Caldimonas brevitalea]AKJ31858.1 hypothetical protein AAW51_5167 [Caldimonas brevitalea]
MPRLTSAVALCAIVYCISPAARSVTPAELAFHHAPVHYQDTDASDPASDYITAFDYDADRISTNNWDNRGNGLWPATAYYSAVESCTHHFITYAFFHPRDWSDTLFDQEHENDLEGVILAIRKDGSTFGKLEGMITVFHTDFYSYTPPDSPYTAGHENIDGGVSFEMHDGVARVKTVQEAKGHGLKAWPYTSDFDGSANQDGVVYFPTQDAATSPRSGNDRNVAYRLVDLSGPGGLWSAALSDAVQPPVHALTFSHWGAFKGDTSGGCGAGVKSCSVDAANAPWGWDDGNDGASHRGEWALDPARLFTHYFADTGHFSQQYVRHPYLAGLRAHGFYSGHLPSGFPAQVDLDSLYGKVVAACP